MRYKVKIKKRVLKKIRALPSAVQEIFDVLQADLQGRGPWLPDWPNYSKLGFGRFHCHLNYSHVACWTHEKDTIIIEVYYVGSRQGAPY